MNTNTKYWTSVTAGILSIASHSFAADLGSEKYTYDSAGNIIAKQIGKQVLRYDYNGNILAKSSDGTIFLHDNTGRHVGENRNSIQARKLSYHFGDKVTRAINDATITNFHYNAEGHLVGKCVGKNSEIFAWDDLGLALRGELVTVNEESMVGGVPTITDGRVTVCDPLGSTISIGDRMFDATAFGEGLEEGLLTGKPYVAELDGFVFKYRKYSSSNGRWTTTDPSGFPDGINNFLYANNEPTKHYDATGLTSDTFTINIDDKIEGSTIANQSAAVSVMVDTSYMTCGVPVFKKVITQSFKPGYNVEQGSECASWHKNQPSATHFPATPKNYSKVVDERLNASLTVWKVEDGLEYKADLKGNIIDSTNRAYEP